MSSTLNNLAELYRKQSQYGGLNPFSNGRWRSRNRRWARNTATWAPASTIWRCFTTLKANSQYAKAEPLYDG